MSEVGYTKRMSGAKFSVRTIFQFGKFPFLFPGLCSLEVEYKLKSTVLEVGLGLSLGSLIIAVLAHQT